MADNVLTIRGDGEIIGYATIEGAAECLRAANRKVEFRRDAKYARRLILEDSHGTYSERQTLKEWLMDQQVHGSRRAVYAAAKACEVVTAINEYRY